MKPLTLKLNLALTSLLLSCFLQSAAAQGNLVINGSFDTDASGWVTTNIGMGAGYQSIKGNPGGYFLLYSSFLSGYPTISQTINSLTPSSSYLISGDYAFEGGPSGGPGNTPSFGVAIDGTFLFQTVTNASWQNFSFFYTASSSSALLSLSSQINGTTVFYGIDNISIVVVPEPSSLCLVGVGGIMSSMFFRNRRKSSR